MAYCNYNKSYFDPFFEALFGKAGTNYGVLPMKADIYESDNAYRLDVEIPGFKKENLNIEVKDGYLRVTAKNEEKAEEGFKRVSRERFCGESSREFYLGEVDEEAITASYTDGVLSILVPKKAPEEPKTHKIEIL